MADKEDAKKAYRKIKKAFEKMEELKEDD